VQVNCLFGGWGTATGTAWFDDVALELLSSEPWHPVARIDAGVIGEPISQYVYGQFIEHLGRCIYGGIWAEMLQDRKFFAAVGADDSPWRPCGAAVVAMDTAAPFVGEHTPVVRAATGGGAHGIAQRDLHLLAGGRYVGYAWLAGVAGETQVEAEVRLCWGDGPNDFAKVQLGRFGPEFRKAVFELSSPMATTTGRLEVIATTPAPLRIGTVSLMPADNKNGMRVDTLALLKRLDAPIYRWPGGNFVSGYDWHDGIGDRDRRPPRKNPAWTGIEHNDFGIHEYIAFCEELGTEPYVVCNSGLGQVDDAVAEIEYFHGDVSTPMGALRAKNGRKAPFHVTWWGVGNEMFGNWQLGHMPLADYIEKHAVFAAAMRQQDPSIKLIGVGEAGRWSEGMLAAGADMDLISEHFYNQEGPGTAAHALQLRDSIRRIADAHRRYRETIPTLAGKDVRIALDEWNYWYGPHVFGELGTRYFQKDALGVAAGLNELARQSDLYFMANYAQTVNVIGAIKTTPTAAAMATTGLVLELYRHQFGSLPVHARCADPIDVMAALTADGKVLTIAAVNPTAEQLTIPLELQNCALTGDGRRFRIAGDPQAYNEPGQSPAIDTREDSVHGVEDLELSPFSVTLLRLDVVAGSHRAAKAQERGTETNLAAVAEASSSHVSGDTSLRALNDEQRPRSSRDNGRGSYGNWPTRGTQWVQYTWSQPIRTKAIDVYWWNDRRGVRTPAACRVQWWDGSAFVPVGNAAGLGVIDDRFNLTTFDAVETERLRLEIDGDGEFSTGVLEWKVYDAGGSPDFAPRVEAGPRRTVVRGGRTWLHGTARALVRNGAPPLSTRWRKLSGPGEVAFADAGALQTEALFTAVGDYTLELEAARGGPRGSATVAVHVVAPPPKKPLGLVDTGHYRIDSRLWLDRAKAVICNWLPHCIAKIEDPDLKEGGLNNFVDAAKALRGEEHQRHRGYVFSNAWIYNTMESICVALMVDAGGDAEILAAQAKLRATLDKWIPIVLAAQEPDGYIQTAFTLSGREHWSPRHRGDHEGYVAGYFLEAGIAHRMLTGDPKSPLWLAAVKLADCWEQNLGPSPKKPWYDGHQAMEMALVRFGRFRDAHDGAGRGDRYIALAKFLLDSRAGGSEYDQSHLPVTQQYEAVGHAVHAAYTYAGMADIAMETGDVDYQSAIASLWDNIVNRKYYVTGGVGAEGAWEGFGEDYALPMNCYCEACSSCGLIFMQHKLNLATHDAKYADLYEETLFNALLGSLDLPGENFFYDNQLDSRGGRYPWHVCPCCVGNIPRTLLMLPTWTYLRGDDGVYVNLFVGSTITVNDVAGTDVELVQQTDYPWRGDVALTVNPKTVTEFALRIRAPDRGQSSLYAGAPAANGIEWIRVNGVAVAPHIENGYATIRRTWQRGDRVDFVLPLPVQKVTAIDAVAATRGKVALRRGPLVYAVEAVDQAIDGAVDAGAPIAPEWREDLLRGVMVLRGNWADASPLLAVPYYARANRLPQGEGRAARTRSKVWIDAK
ncbi:MAG: glycoside hydrolase family 127 protein, partial [Planctomycetes bacterium]|nr:glycoside hydrolase family 127 protein [Planctomycetota bacterium]